MQQDLVKVMILDFNPIGSFQVFSYQTEEEWIKQTPFRHIYWSDQFTIGPQGPFSLVSEALENYKSIIIARRQNKSTLLDKVPDTIRTASLAIINPILSLDEFRKNRPKRSW